MHDRSVQPRYGTVRHGMGGDGALAHPARLRGDGDATRRDAMVAASERKGGKAQVGGGHWNERDERRARDEG